jgi:hypothetical protein
METPAGGTRSLPKAGLLLVEESRVSTCPVQLDVCIRIYTPYLVYRVNGDNTGPRRVQISKQHRLRR